MAVPPRFHGQAICSSRGAQSSDTSETRPRDPCIDLLIEGHALSVAYRTTGMQRDAASVQLVGYMLTFLDSVTRFWNRRAKRAIGTAALMGDLAHRLQVDRWFRRQNPFALATLSRTKRQQNP
jgi:hypothetical protein